MSQDMSFSERQELHEGWIAQCNALTTRNHRNTADGDYLHKIMTFSNLFDNKNGTYNTADYSDEVSNRAEYGLQNRLNEEWVSLRDSVSRNLCSNNLDTAYLRDTMNFSVPFSGPTTAGESSRACPEPRLDNATRIPTTNIDNTTSSKMVGPKKSKFEDQSFNFPERAATHLLDNQTSVEILPLPTWARGQGSLLKRFAPSEFKNDPEVFHYTKDSLYINANSALGWMRQYEGDIIDQVRNEFMIGTFRDGNLAKRTFQRDGPLNRFTRNAMTLAGDDMFHSLAQRSTGSHLPEDENLIVQSWSVKQLDEEINPMVLLEGTKAYMDAWEGVQKGGKKLKKQAIKLAHSSAQKQNNGRGCV
ncbi:uncharacterized protein I206_105065 [Kwoniella pini CBS 10737]|uniref:Uncharacterized protein n=1 Tax=Kwoniella pini CBS 10737 TaxID=1296096 RepID=A0A1B9I8N6_9TREE|nr:uncharacterized protein I206_02605 [Kwoniella pini CBS 10737]OCF51889.1 hypothetical protein I206_02605 [Kwoniella pini CBS 10737]